MSTPLESRSEHPFPLSAVILWVPIACYDPDLWATPWQKGAAGCSLSSCHNCMAFGLSWKCENYGVSSPFRHLNDYVCFVYLWLEIAKGSKEFVCQTLLHSYAWVMAFAFGFLGVGFPIWDFYFLISVFLRAKLCFTIMRSLISSWRYRQELDISVSFFANVYFFIDFEIVRSSSVSYTVALPNSIIVTIYSGNISIFLWVISIKIYVWFWNFFTE